MPCSDLLLAWARRWSASPLALGVATAEGCTIIATDERNGMAKKKRSSRKRSAKAAAKAKRSASPLTVVDSSELARELQRRRASVGKLARRRVRLLEQVEAVDAKLAGLGASLNGSRRRPRNESNLVDALAKLLKDKPMTVTEAAEKVQQAGYKTTSPNFRTIVNQTLLKSKFKRVSRGVYQTK